MKPQLISINTLLAPRNDCELLIKNVSAETATSKLTYDLSGAWPGAVICLKCRRFARPHQLCNVRQWNCREISLKNFIKQRPRARGKRMRKPAAMPDRWTRDGQKGVGNTDSSWVQAGRLENCSHSGPVLQPFWHAVNEEKWPKVFYKCLPSTTFQLCCNLVIHDATVHFLLYYIINSIME